MHIEFICDHIRKLMYLVRLMAMVTSTTRYLGSSAMRKRKEESDDRRTHTHRVLFGRQDAPPVESCVPICKFRACRQAALARHTRFTRIRPWWRSMWMTLTGGRAGRPGSTGAERSMRKNVAGQLAAGIQLWVILSSSSSSFARRVPSRAARERRIADTRARRAVSRRFAWKMSSDNGGFRLFDGADKIGPRAADRVGRPRQIAPRTVERSFPVDLPGTRISRFRWGITMRMCKRVVLQRWSRGFIFGVAAVSKRDDAVPSTPFGYNHAILHGAINCVYHAYVCSAVQ